MHRRLTRGACGPLLGTCVLIAVIWAGSYRSFVLVQPGVSPGATRWELVSYRGLRGISVTPDYPAETSPRVEISAGSRDTAARWDDMYWSGSYGGFCAEDGHTGVDMGDGTRVDRRWSGVVLPYWVMMLLAAASPAARAVGAARARMRASRGQCERCGYEIAGDVCPACAARAAVVGLTPRTHLLLPRM